MNKNKTRDSFYMSSRWKHKRLRILARDKYLCRECKKYGRLRERTEVHHIIHLEDNPSLRYDDDNLVSLCKACHNKRHPEKGGVKKY